MHTAPSLIYPAPIVLILLRRTFNLKDIFQLLIPMLVRSRHVRSPSQISVRTNIIRCRTIQGSLFVQIPMQVDYSHTKNAYPKCSLPLHDHLPTWSGCISCRSVSQLIIESSQNNATPLCRLPLQAALDTHKESIITNSSAAKQYRR